MLKRTKVVSLLAADKPEQEVLVKGWVRTRRDAKDFSFIELNDGSCLKNIQIIANNNIKSITIVRMEVPCCGGIEYAVKKAIQDSGKFLPWQCYTISIDGNIIDE